MMLLSFVPAIAVKTRSRKQVAAFGTPQLTALVATTDEEFVDFGVGVAIAGLLTLTARARADHNEIGKIFGGGALAHRFAQLGKNVRRHLLKELYHGGRVLGAGRLRQVRFAMPADPRFPGHLMVAVPTAHHWLHMWGGIWRIRVTSSAKLPPERREVLEPSVQFDPYTAFRLP
jgi:hypothetical protein